MIGRLRGTLVERRGAIVLIDVNGVGYEVTVSGYTLASLPADGEPVTVHVYTHAVEHKVTLFGFNSFPERELFYKLITVKNVGPSSAIGMLSGGAGPKDIAQMIAGEQTAGLTKIKGVGKKTAQMIVVELREKCELLLASWGASGEVVGTYAPAVVNARTRSPILEDVASALVGMGWRPAEVDKVVDELVVDESATIESLLRDGLRAMSR
jgi:Holliday junction DNA helicase RuvA